MDTRLPALIKFFIWNSCGKHGSKLLHNEDYLKNGQVLVNGFSQKYSLFEGSAQFQSSLKKSM